MPERRTESSEAKAEGKRNLRTAVKRFDLSGLGRDHETWDFLCECGADDCTQWVTLPISEYEVRRAAGDAILAPGHTLREGERQRRRARRLVAEAKALRGQAELQLRRAMRNLKKPPPS
jgi:hypothetical protein